MQSAAVTAPPPISGSLSAGRTGYLPTLDGWRAIAILLVLCNHLPSWPAWSGKLVMLRDYGFLGVDVFFALSGLLICTRLLEEEKAFGRISLANFYWRRLFRITPAAMAYLLVVALLTLLSVLPADWPAWWSAVLFWRNYFTCLVRDTGANRFTGHFWSLAVEEHFYFLLPSVLFFFRRKRLLVLGLLTAACFFWVGLYLHATPVSQRSIYWWRRSDLRLVSLLFPAWLALLYARRGAFASWVGRWLRLEFLLPVALLVCGALYARKHLHHTHVAPPLTAQSDSSENPVDLHRSAPRGGPATLLEQLAAPLLFPLLILSTMTHAQSSWCRWLEWQPLRYIGRLSYSLYLWQQLFWVQYPRWGPLPLRLALVCAAAAASFYWIERPLIRFGHHLAPPATPGHGDVAPAAGRKYN